MTEIPTLDWTWKDTLQERILQIFVVWLFITVIFTAIILSIKYFIFLWNWLF